MNRTPLLSVKELTVSFGNKKKLIEVLHSITFNVFENEIVGIVGESGSGKSVTSLSIMGLLPKKQANLSGNLLFEEKELLKITEKEFRGIRGRFPQFYQHHSLPTGVPGSFGENGVFETGRNFYCIWISQF